MAFLLLAVTTSDVMRTEQSNPTNPWKHSEETRTKSVTRLDSDWAITSETEEPSVTKSKESSNEANIKISDDDKSLMMPFMEDCQSVDSLQQEWSFDYRYTRDELSSLLCRCIGICNTAMPNVHDVHKLRDYFHNPFSDINLTRFIIFTSVYSVLFLVGVIGKFNFFMTGL